MADSGLQKIGVDIVAEGLSSYQKSMGDYIKKTNEATKATTEFQDKSGKAGAKSGGLLGFIQSLVTGFKDVATKATASIPGFESVSSAIGGLSSGALVAAGAVAILATGIFALGTRGAEFIGIQTAFNNTLGQFQESLGTSAEFLRDLRTAAGDTISELELMRITNVALAGATGEAGQAFGESLPRLLEIARVQAAATGQSVDFLFQSLVTGIKRSSPLLIDNTGLVLDITSAQEAYAESIGVTVAQLTEEQKQIALIQATVAAGEQAIANAGGIQETAATKLARANALIQNSLNNLAIAVEPILGGILDVFNFFASGIEQATSVIGPIIREVALRIGSVFSAIAQFISPVVTFIFDRIRDLNNFIVGGIAFFIKGAAAIAGAIGNGLLAGANAFIFPAVISIAQFIADFLSGFSPPKKGPLSTIDTGAANVMMAWTEGFVGAFKPQSIIDVASQVDSELGKIGSLGIGAVEKRIRQLDKALRPFQEQLKIVKDQFDGLKTAADAGLSAIDRQLERLQPALLAGDKQAEAMTRQLNVQRLAIQQNLDAQAEQVDMATLQLAYAQSQQQRERTLLEIQKARLGVQNKQAAAAKKAVTASGSKAPTAPKTGTGGAATGGTGTPAIGAIPTPATAENPLAGFDQFTGEVGAEFMDFLSAGGELKEFQGNALVLEGIFEDIGKSNPVQGIMGAFEGFGTALQDNFVTPITEKVAEGVRWFTDPTLEGGLAYLFNRIRNEGVGAVLGMGDLAGVVTTFFTDNLSTPIQGAITGVTAFIIGDAETSLKTMLTNFFVGTGEGSLFSILASAVSMFGLLPTQVTDSLRGFGLSIWNAFVLPVINALNTVIQNINTFLEQNQGFGELIAAALGVGGLAFSALGQIPLLPTTPPEGLVGAAKGGIFTGGAINVGERGRETMMSAAPFAVFSNQFVRAMDTLSNAILSGGMMSTQIPVMATASAGNVSNTRNININANMRGEQSPIQIANTIALGDALA